MTAVAHPRLATAVLTVGDGVTLSVVLPEGGYGSPASGRR